jgi:polyisoprenoid-binding protein YceI
LIPRCNAVLAGLALAAAASASAQRLVPEQSEVAFTSRQMGVPVDGRFRRFDAQVALDPRQPEAARIRVTVDTGSATFGAPETDAEAVRSAWFDAARFPQATFRSASVTAQGSGRYLVAGTLSLKGRERDVVVPVTLTFGSPHAVATGSFTVKRLDFAIGAGEWSDTSLVADDVQVHFKLALAGLPPH